MSESEKHKAQLRRWIYEILAELETAEDVKANKQETPGRKVTLEIQFKV